MGIVKIVLLLSAENHYQIFLFVFCVGFFSCLQSTAPHPPTLHTHAFSQVNMLDIPNAKCAKLVYGLSSLVFKMYEVNEACVRILLLTTVWHA